MFFKRDNKTYRIFKYQCGYKHYKLPEQACVFCKNCDSVLWDHHGIYCIICDKSGRMAEIGNVNCLCKQFEPDGFDYEEYEDEQ